MDTAFVQESGTRTAVTEQMFADAEQAILGAVPRKLGFGG